MDALRPKNEIVHEEPPKSFADEDFLRTSATEHRKWFEAQIEMLFEQQGLTFKEIVETHKRAQYLGQITNVNFYETTVVLRSVTLRREAEKIIAAVAASFEQDVITFCVDNRFYTEESPTKSEFFADIGSDAEIAEKAITHVFAVQGSDMPIDKIVRWWRNALHEEATKKVSSQLRDSRPNMIKASIELTELQMLLDNPWVVSERLLGAFQDVQTFIKNQLDEYRKTMLIYTRELG